MHQPWRSGFKLFSHRWTLFGMCFPFPQSRKQYDRYQNHLLLSEISCPPPHPPKYINSPRRSSPSVPMYRYWWHRGPVNLKGTHADGTKMMENLARVRRMTDIRHPLARFSVNGTVEAHARQPRGVQPRLMAKRRTDPVIRSLPTLNCICGLRVQSFLQEMNLFSC